MEIKQKLLPATKYNLKCPYIMKPEFITIHNTANDAAAANEINYMISNSNQTSFHIAVDDKEAIQGIPFNRAAWHAGDGSNGAGNRKSIGIEICYSKSGGVRFEKALENTIEVVVQLMKEYNIPASGIRYHQDWSGKYCPHRLLDMGITVKEFRKMVEKKLETTDYENHWARAAIESMIEKKIMVGSGDGKFRPTDNITRAEVAQVIDNLLKYGNITKS